MTLAYHCFTATLLLFYGSLFLNGIYYCLSVFQCAVTRMSVLELEKCTDIKFLIKLGKIGSEIREMLVQVYRDNTVVCHLKAGISESEQTPIARQRLCNHIS
jgi:hypothetical protein